MCKCNNGMSFSVMLTQRQCKTKLGGHITHRTVHDLDSQVLLDAVHVGYYKSDSHHFIYGIFRFSPQSLQTRSWETNIKHGSAKGRKDNLVSHPGLQLIPFTYTCKSVSLRAS
jgi:hypothetical protein